MQACLRHIQQIVRTKTSEQLFSVLVEVMASYGFDRIVYGLSRTAKPEIAPECQDLGFFTNIVDGEGKPIVDQQTMMRTPMFRWALNNRGACSWSHAAEELAAGRLTPEEVAAYRHRQRMGVIAGYTISFVDPALRGLAVLSLTARPGLSQEDVDALWAARGEEIELIADVMHLKMRGLPIPIRRRRLSRRQREALEWVAAGKTTQDIATIMGVSPAMVEKHLKLVRETLDVGTTAQAVAKAAMLNHLFALDESHPPKEG